MTDVRSALMVGRTSDGKPVHRPLSPHLQVYRWPITMALSILHRVTGVALGVGTLLLVWWLVAASQSDAAYATVSGFVASPIGYLLLFGWTVALWFHLLSGLRHLFWDAGRGFELPTAHASSVAVLVGTGVLTVLTWVVGLIVL